jgi:phenylalanyl-tRNA synthetase alpha chain
MQQPNQMSSLLEELKSITASIAEQINASNELASIESIRVSAFGKKGLITGFFAQLRYLEGDQKKAFGQHLNQAKQTLFDQLQTKQEKLKKASIEKQMAGEAVDITLPPRGQGAGSRHPVSCIRHRIVNMFAHLGFQVIDGPEIETVENNFTRLNMPENHPARAMHDTFYFDPQYLLRTHTSTMQIRTLAERSVPIRMIGAGRVYRHDYDPTHTPMFHQLEGMVIDRDINFSQLKTLLSDFLKQLFGERIAVRFRPSYFPFTEPSAEVDIRIASQSSASWLEVLGCGMVHPNVLRMAGVDPGEYQGFAFGLGLDRLAMIAYGIDDLRSLFTNDIEFLAQFNIIG